jgi:hypothetical protein
MLLRERGNNVRREVATGSFTAAVACGAAIDAAAVCASALLAKAQTNTEAKRQVNKMRFIRYLLHT